MKAHADQTKENKNQSHTHNYSQQQSGSASVFQLEDNRPDADRMRALQEIADNSPHAWHGNAVQEMANRSVGLQVKGLGNCIQLQSTQLQGLEEDEKLLQGKFETTQLQSLEEDEEPLQGKFKVVQRIEGVPINDDPSLEREADLMGTRAMQAKVATQTAQRQEAEPIAAPNLTGLPDPLKAGIEHLSGMSLDNVRVHTNSPKPARLNALAYTQGSEIHVAPGQEKHLPHEAWHVVQQTQGRVQTTRQMKKGVPVNNEAALEREADEIEGRDFYESHLSGYKRQFVESREENISSKKNNPSRMPIQYVFNPTPNLVAAHHGTIVNALNNSLAAVPDGNGGVVNLITDPRIVINMGVAIRRDPNPADILWGFQTAAGGGGGGLQPVNVTVNVVLSNWFLRQDSGLVISEFNHELGVHFIPFLGPILNMWPLSAFANLNAGDFITVENLSNNNADHIAASTIGNANFGDYQNQVVRSANFLVGIGNVNAARNILFGYLMDISSLDNMGDRIVNPLTNAGNISNQYAIYWANLNAVIGAAGLAMPAPTISRIGVIWEYAKLIPSLIRMVLNP